MTSMYLVDLFGDLQTGSDLQVELLAVLVDTTYRSTQAAKSISMVIS